MPHGTAQLEGFLTESKHLFYLNLKKPGDPNDYYERLARGFMSFEPEMNEENSQDSYLDGNGFATSTVTGGQLTFSFGGHRYFGDPVQDWIAQHMPLLGNNRETDFIWIQPNGDMISGPVTLAVINGPSGDANQKGEIEVEIHFNGEPTITTVPAPANLATSNETATTIDLDWDVVVVEGAIVTYDVYQNGLLVAEDVATNTHTATDLITATEYNFYVVTVATLTSSSIEIKSEPSATVSGTTL